MSRRRHCFLLGCLAILSGCGEKPQTATAETTVRKSDEKAWHQPVAKDLVAPGWKADDQASWEQQIRQRGQNQNEYARAAAKP